MKKYHVYCSGIFGDKDEQKHFSGFLFSLPLTNFGEIEAAEKVIAEVEKFELQTSIHDVRILSFSSIPFKGKMLKPTFVLHQR
ncbi:MAG: hypothetical protein PHG25_00460 [Candidatus Pacebacteria bacterium]|nr:hypothetical protein [Candidatus Paceibacterota bacterium]